jgi:hypothetical protein
MKFTYVIKHIRVVVRQVYAVEHDIIEHFEAVLAVLRLLCEYALHLSDQVGKHFQVLAFYKFIEIQPYMSCAGTFLR